MRCPTLELSFLTILVLLFSTVETRSIRSSRSWKASGGNEQFFNSENRQIDAALLEEKLEPAKMSLAGTMRIVGLVGEEFEEVVQAWENLLPDILACYASLSGGEEQLILKKRSSTWMPSHCIPCQLCLFVGFDKVLSVFSVRRCSGLIHPQLATCAITSSTHMTRG